MSRRSSLNISRAASPLGPASSRFAASGPIVVDVSFDSPVVFAGQALIAKITFRNPNAPIPTDHLSVPSSITAVDISAQDRANSVEPFVAAPRGGSSLHPPSSDRDPNTNDTSQETTQENGDSLWDIPGRKLSVQIASTFRDLYFNNSSSSPELPAGSMRPHSPVKAGGSARGLHRSGSVRESPPPPVAAPSLLMGYAQVQGYFVVDDELVDVSQFAHAKTQGVVVGASGLAYAAAPQTGFLHGLASGIGSLFQLKDAEAMSSRNSPGGPLSGRVRAGSLSNGLTRSPVLTPTGANNARSGATTPTAQGTSSVIALTNTGPAPANAVPIFSTPQSLLFVDLKLAPGEKRVFYYKLPLPKTLPPSCRAKSLRIHYNLVIGTQKLIRGTPVPKTTFVPFRVFPYVDKYGQQYTHDLKSPIVLQRDDALVASIPVDKIPSEEATAAYIAKLEATSTNNSRTGSKDAKNGNGCNTRPDFESYVADMLREINAQQQHEDSSTPEEKKTPDIKPPESPVAPLFSQPTTGPATQVVSDDDPRNNIEHFTRFQQTKPPARPLKTRYDIGRAGRRIAAITFSKAVYRVGDSVLFMIDFTRAALKCFHVTVALETEEAISPDVLKQFNENTDDEEDDNQSRQQKNLPVVDTSGLTRRVYSQATTSTYATSKTAFEFTIPATATPQFNTSAIALKWVLKMDFITSPAAAPPMVSEIIGGSTHGAGVPTGPAHERTASTSELSADQQVSDPNHLAQAMAGLGTNHQARPENSAPHSGRSFVPEDILQDIPDDPHSVMEIVSVSPKGVIAVAKETIACEAFSCKVPLNVVPTNQDISALLRHSVSSTRSWEL